MSITSHSTLYLVAPLVVLTSPLRVVVTELVQRPTTIVYASLIDRFDLLAGFSQIFSQWLPNLEIFEAVVLSLTLSHPGPLAP